MSDLVLRDSARLAVASMTEPAVVEALGSICPGRLAARVRSWAIPRHRIRQLAANRRVAGEIAAALAEAGYRVELQGRCHNVVATTEAARSGIPCRLFGAHYDSVPQSPGADDNASSLAALVEGAAAARRAAPDASLAFVAFNCEEDRMLGSRELVAALGSGSLPRVTEAHVLEMVGYRRREPGSQRCPAELPVARPSSGDFLGVVANELSVQALRRVVDCAAAVGGDLRVIGLEVYAGREALLPVLSRSDHASFWQARIPATMWTDTAEYRNPHYHAATDTPDTLDYDFVAAVTRLLVAVAADVS